MTQLRAGFPAIGTTATVVAHGPEDLVAARAALEAELAAIDLACSRFRRDSEVAWLQAAAGRAVPVSALLWDALVVAHRAHALTGGLVDPTVGSALVALGYDRDFAELDPAAAGARTGPAPGWRAVTMDAAMGTVRVAPGVVLDLGATAKALAVDRAAAALRGRCRAGVLLDVGGDVVVAGPAPADGWVVRVADSHLAGEAEPGVTVVLHDGALATSAPGVRRWGPAGATSHHIVDPRTGRPAPELWRSVSVAAATCVDANIASTAAVLLGGEAPAWLEARRLPALLRPHDGAPVTTAGWPTPEMAA